MRIPTPTVPVSTQSVGQFTAPTAVPMQDATGPMLQEVAQSLQSAGNAVSRIGADVQADLDQGFLAEADAIASEEVRQHVGELRQKAGLDAIESFEPMHRTLKDRLLNLRDSARSPQQRRAVDRILAQRFQDASDAMVSHRDRAAREHAIGGSEAGRLAAVNDYQASIGNPENMELARQIALDRTAELSRLRGEGEEAAKLSMLDTTTRLHMGAASSLLQAGRSSEAEAYLAQWGHEMGAQDQAKVRATVRAAVIEDTARNLSAELPTLGDRIRWVQSNLAGEEAEVARQHLVQIEQRRMQEKAVEAKDVRQQAEQWLNANPALDLRANPALAKRVADLGVAVERTYTTNPAFVQWLREMPPDQVSDWQRMPDAVREELLRPYLSDHDLKRWQAFFAGEQDVVGRADRIKRAAEYLGIVTVATDGRRLSKEEQQNNAKALGQFEQHIQLQVDLRRAEKKRDLTTHEIQEEILDPMMMDRVWLKASSWFSSDKNVPLIAAQVDGRLPVDDPYTLADESATPAGADSVYVKVNGRAEYLYQIPLVERERIRLAWAQKYPGRQLTAQREMEVWIEAGRPGDTATKRARDAEAERQAGILKAQEAMRAAFEARAYGPWQESPR